MSRYAEVIIDIAYNKLDRPFTYRVPGRMQQVLQPGSLVMVPFGSHNGIRKGYVIALKEECDLPPEKIKEIAELPVSDSGYSEDEDGATAIALAAWMKNRCGSTMAAALKTVLTSRKPGKPVRTREIELKLSREEALKQLEVYTRKHQVARERLLRELLEVPRQPYSLVVSKLHITAPVIRAMAAAGVIEIREEESFRNPVNISIIRGICARGKKAIMLIPEIALTYQTLLRFYQYFGEKVSVMNSSLSESEKADQWERARRGEIDVIIGPRSALFTPFSDLGVIVIDEEHEGSYKNESMPKYHTREVAEELARLKKACVVLGSATPSLDTYYKAEKGEYRLYRLTHDEHTCDCRARSVGAIMVRNRNQEIRVFRNRYA